MHKIKHISALCFILLSIVSTPLSGKIHKITTPLPADSVLKLPIDSSLTLIFFVDYTANPQLIPATNNLIFKISKNAIKNNYTNYSKLIHNITRYASRNMQFQFGIDILESIYKNKPNMDQKNQLLLLKMLGFFYNKIGEFGISLDIFESGLQKAEEANLMHEKIDFYHHLCHEYVYLSMIDSNYTQEVKRLKKKCYQYAKVTKDSIARAFQTISLMDGSISVEEINKQREEARSLLNPNVLEYWDRLQNLEAQYLEALYKNHHYHEYIKASHQIHDSVLHMYDLLLAARLTQCYLKTNDLSNAHKYAKKIKSLFHKNPDQDVKRQVLIWTPELFEKLGLAEEAYYFSEERNKSMQKQITNKRRLNSERERFDRELGKEIDKSEHQRIRNRYMTAGLVLLAIVLIIIGWSARALNSKNKLIHMTLDELEVVNHNLNQANKDLESFAYASAHDIKNPLNTISGFMQLVKLDETSTLSANSQAYIESVDTSITDVTSLITSILRYAKLGSQEIDLQEIDFNQKIDKVKLLLNQQIIESKAEIYVEPKLVTTLGEPELLQQLILNLISNAIKYSRPDVPPVLEISSSQDEHSVYFRFRDYGIGIPEDNLRKIFSLFGRAHNSHNYEGVGVGLAVCLKIANLHKGKLTVQNNPDYGATFILQLPLHSKKERQLRQRYLQHN